ncbi:MAG: FAD-binding oxidoreductase [Candidatus Baltobacteraceae bacterium]
MKRRRLLQLAASGASLALWPHSLPAADPILRRRRPPDASWPSQAAWAQLDRATGGNLIAVRSPLSACTNATSPSCANVFANLHNPYFIGNTPALTQTLGWTDAWTSSPSIYAVAARNAHDVAAAVDFARNHDLRLVVKGGGHSYLGTSNAPDSLLVWTRHMREIEVHDAFVAQGCDARPQPAVTIESGALWVHAYDAVTTKAGRYVQGGGCTTVGVAGLIQSGGFGSFSKHYGMAAAALLEAEVVTADGKIRIANACTNPDLFWALKGGGGGSFGVVTRLTLRTRELPQYFGFASMTIKASSPQAFQRLVREFVSFYAEHLFGDRWGEHVAVRENDALEISMVSYDVEGDEATKLWQPFLDWVGRRPGDYSFDSPPRIASVPPHYWWDPVAIEAQYPKAISLNTGPDARPGEFWWAGDGGQVGQFLYGYESLWLPATLLEGDAQEHLADALFAASRHNDIELHFNKGLAGAPADAIAAARDTATNPTLLHAFALAISADGQGPAYPGIGGHEPDDATGRERARQVDACMNELRAIVPGGGGSYLSESNFFEPAWQRSYWGSNYPRLAAVKKQYDPGGLFFVHHGVGSEAWSADGFTRLSQ